MPVHRAEVPVSKTSSILRNLTLGGLLLASPGVFADDVADRAEELAALRTEVQRLTEALELEQEAVRRDLQHAELRKVELSSSIRSEQRRLDELERAVEQAKALIEGAGTDASALTLVLGETLRDLKGRVAGGLPYRVDERIGSIESLQDRIAQGELDPRKAASRVWQLLEDEMRLNRENGMDRQVVMFGGEETFVDVARVGMVALYFRTHDGRYGQAIPAADGWTYQLATADQHASLEAFFDALERQIRVGWFTLPTPTAEVTQ